MVGEEDPKADRSAVFTGEDGGSVPDGEPARNAIVHVMERSGPDATDR